MYCPLVPTLSRCTWWKWSCQMLRRASGAPSLAGTTVTAQSRPPKKKNIQKKTLNQQEEQQQNPNKSLEVVAYSAADQFNLSVAKETVEGIRGQYTCERMPEVVDAISFSRKPVAAGGPSRFFVFDHGSVVFWNLEQEKRSEILQLLATNRVGGPEIRSLEDLESESIDYVMDSTAAKSRINERGELILSSDDEVKQPLSPKPGNNHNLKSPLSLEQYAVSNAMSLSVKLSNWETSLDDFADSIQFVAESMASGTKLNITKTQVFQKTGQLFRLRHHINLGTDMFDTPDFYWDREDLEILFKSTCSCLSIGKRARLMNDKLTYCYELMQLLTSHLDQEHNTKLEWMIIILIAVEVVFEIVHFL